MIRFAIFTIHFLAVSILLVGCNEKQPESEPLTEEDQEKILEIELEELAEQKAAIMIAEQKALEEQAELEIAKIAEEQLRQRMLAEQKRREVAAKMEARNQQRLETEARKIEDLMIEKVERENLLEMVQAYVDSFELFESGINGEYKTQVNGEYVENGSEIVLSDGETIIYSGKEDPYHIFKLSSGDLEAKYSRKIRGVSKMEVISDGGLESTLEELKTNHEAELQRLASISSAKASEDTLPSFAPVSVGDMMLIEAKWGSETNSSDVKETVRDLLQREDKDYFRTSSSDMGGDPAPGSGKTLKLRWFAHGKLHERNWEEGKRIQNSEILNPTFNEPETATPSGVPKKFGSVIIMHAVYGAEQTWVDVKDSIGSRINSGELRIEADSELAGGDPIFGKVKHLRIKYVKDGKSVTEEIREGDYLDLR